MFRVTESKHANYAVGDIVVGFFSWVVFDTVYSYKTIPYLTAAIKEGCLNGVDVFFDNVQQEIKYICSGSSMYHIVGNFSGKTNRCSRRNLVVFILAGMWLPNVNHTSSPLNLWFLF